MVTSVLSAIGRRCTYANVASTLALALALGTGTAYAANTVRSKDIVNGQVKVVDLGKNSVTGPKVKNGAMTAADLGPDSVGAAQIQNDGVGSTEVAQNSIDGDEVADSSMTAADLAGGAVGTSEVASNSLTTSDLLGTDLNGSISLGAGAVVDGDCRTFQISAGSTEVGQGVIVNAREALPSGMFIYGGAVVSNGTAEMVVCNFSGAASPALVNFGVRTISFDN